MTTINTPIPKNKNKNKIESGEECREGGRIGEQAFFPATQRSIRSAGKAAANKIHGRTSRTDSYGAAIGRAPRVNLTKIYILDYKVESDGSTFKITMGADGGFLHKEVVDPQPGPSELGNPHTPAKEIREGASREVSPAPTEIMAPTDSQDRVADVDDDSLNGSDGEIDVVEEAISVEEAEKRGPGRPPTTGEHVGKKAREEEKPKFGKRRRRNEGQPNPSE